MDSGARSFDLGGVNVTLLRGGALRLDGGAMFGIIPKTIWSRAAPADEENRIQLACNCLLVEWTGPGAARRAVIETGHGPKYAEKEQRIFAIDPSDWLLTDLQARGVDPASITDIVVSHLHFDHAGGLTREDGPGNFVPTFSNARVHVQRREFDDARANFGIMTITYREQNFRPIDSADAWRLVDGDRPILDNLLAIRTPGHTRGHQSILVEGRDRSLVFAGDVMPTAAHVGRPYNMGYDLFPLDNRDSKGRLLRMAAERDWIVVIDHEPTTPAVRVVADRDWFTLVPA